MLVNKAMKSNFLLYAMGTRTSKNPQWYYDGITYCGGNNLELSNSIDMNSTDLANRLLFFTEQPIAIDNLVSNSGCITDDSCSDTTYDNQTDCETNGATWTSRETRVETTKVLEYSLTGTCYGDWGHDDAYSKRIQQIAYSSNDASKSPLVTGTIGWFLLMRDDTVILMGEVTDTLGDGDVKLSKVDVTPEDSFRFYSLKFEGSETSIFTDSNVLI